MRSEVRAGFNLLIILLRRLTQGDVVSHADGSSMAAVRSKKKNGFRLYHSSML